MISLFLIDVSIGFPPRETPKFYVFRMSEAYGLGLSPLEIPKLFEFMMSETVGLIPEYVPSYPTSSSFGSLLTSRMFDYGVPPIAEFVGFILVILLESESREFLSSLVVS